MSKRYAVVLAAGQGTRMKSKLYKVMHPVMGKPMVGHVVDAALEVEMDKIVTVTGVGAETVQEYLRNKSAYVLQEEQLGTAHAVKQAASILKDKEGTTLVICGDTPLLTSETLSGLVDFHESEGAKATVLTAHANEPFGYGRVIRSNNGAVMKIVEQKDASEEETKVQEINTGTYCFDNKALFNALEKVTNENIQGEYYLPDVIEILKKQGELVAAFQLDNMDEALGVNDRVALAQAYQSMKKRINEQHMRNGVSIIDPANTYIESNVKIGQDTVIEPGVYLKGNTEIGRDVLIGAHSVIADSKIGNNVKITSSTIEESIMGDNSDIGPNSHLRPQTILKESVHIGNYVEVKKATIGNNTKIGHLTYVGDAELGENINIGCGTVFVNYDGKNKHKINIGDNAFIGCNANLIAPVTVEKNTYVAAGSTITDTVPENALAIARARQTIKEGYFTKMPQKD
ncbi:bifunctional UDP-N-acetylglucosamine diphosphorylase/glucosamine-1-phosphate N-acetyltransferase GlmU [Marinilactibacillus psychrotolerans]|uniref:Bifunctional protein GlmU n=2 Tax=Marinilactibacillus psychrotolerans TaxID=191770 RepID=A0A5R9C598_9LACT|nr:bifunctional UDP-N-acetylglucosamine diphosphorylase/glucosamine-1-phosphate N-acetyltransferase GlmU [Marinilactibacillus psychrotolerans]TLQ08138.1 bifunctional UDP-N-acetylglucosamine diphosphorylase/glucosamine-1-phosphate N-acetyltransferase GlmU [Marinilactibacillus psychrotolerans]GEQ32443.1 UDP-N-acetylglucosamine pyrophosphorylase [Marinilactibacillus psychrotolerans]SJN44376.1 N-acetylglucosamine-1-phosphate uridyltransferase / Glucosamine-1-phosphate N-acetyltransferase [Marinilact